MLLPTPLSPAVGLIKGMRFCPKDGSLLDAVAKRSTQGLTSTEFCCRVCKYSEDLKRPLVDTTVLTPKRAEDVMGGKDQWADSPITQTPCPKCNHNEAYYVEQQTRGGDEAMTVFYRCAKCKHQRVSFSPFRR